MKIWKLILSAGASLLAMTAHASADPVSIGFFLFAGPLGSVFSFSALVTASQIGLYALGIGASLLSSVIGQQKQRVDPGQYKNTFESSESSEVNAIGRVGLGGLTIFGNTAQTDRYRLIGHASGPLVAIEEYKLGGREVTVEETGDVSSPPYARVGGSYVNIQSKIGDGTETAWPDLITAFPDLWTSAHRVRGIAQSLVKYVSPGIYTERFGKMYQGGEPPLSLTARMNTVYDPRVPGADKDNPATWVWSMNGPLCAARIMLAYPDVNVDSFDWDFIAAEADKADAEVATLTGTEPRSRLSGIWLSEAKRGDTMDDVLRSTGTEVTTSEAGLIRIRLIDDDPAAEIAFTTRHMTEFSWQSGPEAVDRPNVCRVKYYSAERNFEMTDIDLTGIAWARVEDEIARYGEQIYDVELPFCPSASQAQRIARREFLLKRGDTGLMKTNMVGMAAWGLTYAAIELPDLDETPVCRIAPPKIDDEGGEVEIPFVVWPQELIAAPWNPATMEAAAPEPVPDLQFQSNLDTPAAPSQAIQIVYPDASREVRLAFAPVAGATAAEANSRSYTDGLPNAWSSMTEQDLTLAYSAADLEGQAVDFRVRFFNADDEGSYFSPLLEVASLAQDNAATGAPDGLLVLVDEATGERIVQFSVPELRAASAVVETDYSGSYTAHDTFDVARPGITYESTPLPTVNPNPAPSPSITVNIRVSSRTSNGTIGAYWTDSYVIPGNI